LIDAFGFHDGFARETRIIGQEAHFSRVEGKLSSILSSKKLVADGAAVSWRYTSDDTPRYWMILPSLNSISRIRDLGS
jgi:hypothetical protein